MTDLCGAMNKFGKGIGNVPRYRIVEALFAGPKTVGDLVKKTKQSQPLVSQNLRILKEAGLVRDERSGKMVVYTLNAEHMINLIKCLSDELNRKKKEVIKKK